MISLASFCFDVSVSEIFGTLICGGTLEIASSDLLRDPPNLLKSIYSSNITVLQGTSSIFKSLIDVGFTCNDKKITLLCGGETLTIELASKLLERGFTLWNFFGATEATVSTILYNVQKIEGNL